MRKLAARAAVVATVAILTVRTLVAVAVLVVLMTTDLRALWAAVRTVGVPTECAAMGVPAVAVCV